MSQGKLLPDPDLVLINAKSLDFAKPKLFFKNIGRYTATLTYIHVRIPFNFTQTVDTRISSKTIMLSCLINMKNLSKQSPKPLRMSA